MVLATEWERPLRGPEITNPLLQTHLCGAGEPAGSDGRHQQGQALRCQGYLHQVSVPDRHHGPRHQGQPPEVLISGLIFSKSRLCESRGGFLYECATKR